MTTDSPQQRLNLGVGHHQAGRLHEAEAIYRQVLAQDPEHADALHLLGCLAFETGNFNAAIDLIGRAVAIAPAAAAYHCNLGESYRRAGQTELAIASLRRAIELEPGLVDAQNNLGAALKHAGRADEAITAFRRAVELNPDFPEALGNLASALIETGALDDAIAAYRRAIALRPDFAELYSHLGSALTQKGTLDDAIAAYCRAIALSPDFAEAHSNLGNALFENGAVDDAIVACRRAIALRPDFAAAHNNLGNALKQAGALDDAIAAYRRAIALRPGFAEAHSNLGSALKQAGAIGDAVAAYRCAIALAPDFAEAQSNLGSALTEQGALDDAILACRHAVALKPDFAEAQINLGRALTEKGVVEEAIVVCRHALALKPDSVEAQSNLGSALTKKGALDDAIAAYRRAVELNPGLPGAFFNLAGALLAQGDHAGADQAFRQALTLRPEHIAADSGLLMSLQYQHGATLAGLGRAHAEWGARHAPSQSAAGKRAALDRDPERPLRLGFLSPDLHRHPVGIFLVRAVENLDRTLFTNLFYSTDGAFDDLSDRIARTAGAWHNVVGLDDDALAARIRADRVDILFDLSGHTAGHRLLVFERRPAPIQISWIGYAGTTGLRSMDYLIADRYHVPAGAEAHYSETVLRMPDGYVCYDPPAEAPAIGPLPVLARGKVTFGCFNKVSKLTPAVIALWARIIGSVPGSRLLLAAQGLNGSIARDWIRAAFVSAGGDPHRLELQGAKPWLELLDAYNAIDVALDPFPYSGGLTTCEALWMGVPVVTCPGETFAGRHSLSHLSNVGLTETIAADEREYIEVAWRLAGDLPHLAALRAGLRERMARSPLCDGERFGRHLMAVLRDLWRQHCHQA